MQYGPPMQSSAEEAEYYFQELRAPPRLLMAGTPSFE
jgi:hypothetical protein